MNPDDEYDTLEQAQVALGRRLVAFGHAGSPA